MSSRFDRDAWNRIQSLAYAIREWLSDYDMPERYEAVNDLAKVRDFLHIVDLMETILCHVEIASVLACDTISNPALDDFWGFDVEEFFVSSQLEACYQLSNGCREIRKLAQEDALFGIFSGTAPELNETWLARHKVTHFRPDQFESHPIAERHTILRRPYSIKDGVLVKQLARDTGPRFAAFLGDATSNVLSYLEGLHGITCGSAHDEHRG